MPKRLAGAPNDDRETDMKCTAFDYRRPAEMEEMLELLADLGPDARVLAGGQSMVPAMNFRLMRPEVLLDANALPDLDRIEASGDTLHVGAMVRHAAFHRKVADGPTGRLLSLTVPHIAHYPIRQRGTFGGSLAHADPAAEWCLLSVLLDAGIEARSRDGARVIPASEFFRASFTTALGPGEMLTGVRLPLLGGDWHVGFNEFARRAGDYALAMAGAAVRLGADGRIAAARLALGSLAGRPARLPDLESALEGEAPDPGRLREIVSDAGSLVDVSEDIHASAGYRRELCGVVLGRALRQALETAPKEAVA